MQIAKWKPATQTPYDIREFGSLKAGNGVPLKDWASYAVRGYFEYIPVQLAEGEGLANPTYALLIGVISQGGTIIGAEAMRSIAQQARHDHVLAMADAYGADVAILGELLDSIGVPLPCTPEDVKNAIKAMPKGQRPDGLMGDFSAAYSNCRENMTDADIAAVAALGA